jgi:uncharacterized protein YfaA (DUF2138 family)
MLFLAVLAVSAAVALAAAVEHAANWKPFQYPGTLLKVDLTRPDAVIRTASLARLPRDLLRAPIARDVLTEELAFYYEQHEDRLGLAGALKRMAFEYDLGLGDRILASALNEPAELAFWRDGRGALRHYAVVIRRNFVAQVLQQLARVAANDAQLKLAGEIPSSSGKLKVFALEVNPRRTFLLVGQGDRLVLLSDPGLLLDGKQKANKLAAATVVRWLEEERPLSTAFALDGTATHTLAIGKRAMALGYGDFIGDFKGLRFDFNQSWSTSVWLAEGKSLPAGNLQLWQSAPANPAACVAVPVDWPGVARVIREAESGPELPDATVLSALSGAGLVCWYAESRLYSPLFIARLPQSAPRRDAALQALAGWAISAKRGSARGEAKVWQHKGAMLASRGDLVAFSPDGELVKKMLDTLARSNPNITDQLPASDALLALVTPRTFSEMAGREITEVVKKDANQLAVVRTHLPPKLRALASYPPQRLVWAGKGSGWQPLEWQAQ